MCAQQIPFALPVDPSMGEDDFLITPSNQMAASQLNQDGPVLLLGPKGTGKSHLARIWQKRNKAALFDVARGDIAALHSAVMWEDADHTGWNAHTQENAFHLLNTVKEKKLALLITAATPPAQWKLTLADLRSRLLALPVAQMDMPDDALVAGLLLKHFKDRQLRVSEEVLNYMIPRIARDGVVIERVVRELDTLSLANNRAITIPLIRKILD
jgi:chromosomal replication initiation ATPase DnaA